MIIFLYGPDEYRRDQKKKFYIQEFAKKYSIHGLEKVSLASGETRELTAAAQSRSLFEPAKLILLEDAFEVSPKKLKQGLESFMEDKKLNVVIVADKKPTKPYSFLLEKPATALEFPNLKDAAWKKFVASEAEKIGADLEPEALAFLAKTYENNSWGLVTELQKLAGSDRRLGKNDLASLGLEVAPEFFPLVQSLRSQNLSIRFAALASLLHQNEPGAKIFNIISALWVQKTPLFAAYDRAIKMGRMDYEEALLDLLAS